MYRYSMSGCGGASLLYLIAAMATLGALAVGVSHFTATSTQTIITDNRGKKAYYLALSGLNGWRQMQQPTNPATFTIGNDTITLSYTGSGLGSYDVKSIGTSQGETGFESNFLISKTIPAETEPINDLGEFGVIENKQYSVVIVDPNNSTTPSGYNATAWATFYKSVKSYYNTTWLRLASDLYDSNGAAWYRGSRGFCPGGVCPTGCCINGKCGFGNGLRVVFSFKFRDADYSKDVTAHRVSFVNLESKRCQG